RDVRWPASGYRAGTRWHVAREYPGRCRLRVRARSPSALVTGARKSVACCARQPNRKTVVSLCLRWSRRCMVIRACAIMTYKMTDARKIIHVTDLHLGGGSDAIVNGWHVEQAWQRIVDDVLARHPDAGLWVLGGDLMDKAEAAGYRRLN